MSKVREFLTAVGRSLEGGTRTTVPADATRLDKLNERTTQTPAGSDGSAGVPGAAAPAVQNPAAVEEEKDEVAPAVVPEDPVSPDDNPEEKKEDPTMADAPKNTDPKNPATAAAPVEPAKTSSAPGNPAPLAAATIDELQAAFPAADFAAALPDVDRSGFILEAVKDNLTVLAAKSRMLDKMMANGSARAAVHAALGVAGKSSNPGGSSPREAGAPGKASVAAEAAKLMDPVNAGYYLPVPGAKTYQEALSGYLNAGLKLRDAHRWAQHNHDDLWTAQKKKLGADLLEKQAKNPRK